MVIWSHWWRKLLNFFQAVAMYGCTARKLQKSMGQKPDGNYTNHRKQHLTKQQVYGHLLLISQTIQVRQIRYAEHCWWSKDELTSKSKSLYRNWALRLSVAASHQTGLDTWSKARRQIKVGIKGGGEGREGAETRTLPVYAAHQLTWCNVSMMRQAVSRTQMWVRVRMPGYRNWALQKP